jgi:hypothetical protein
MDRGMAGVRHEWAAATCGVYAGARLVGRRGAGTAALRPMDAKHVAPRELQERWFYGAWTGGSSAASAFGPEWRVAVSARDAARRDATSCRAALWLKAILSTLL